MDSCGLFESVCHGEAVEPVVVKCNVANREQNMAQPTAYSHMDFSRVIKIKMDSRWCETDNYQIAMQVIRSHSAVTFHPSENVRKPAPSHESNFGGQTLRNFFFSKI